MKVGITGHQKLENPSAWGWVEEKLKEELAKIVQPLVGVSSLAVGADQMFARLVLQHGGRLIIVLPFNNYERTFAEGDERMDFNQLLKQSSKVETLPTQITDEESYFAAGKRVVEISDLMFTVWNGKKAAGLGGTGDAVKYALERGKSVIHFNPINFEVNFLSHSNSS